MIKGIYRTYQGSAPNTSLIPHPHHTHHTSPVAPLEKGLWGGSCYGSVNAGASSISTSGVSLANWRGHWPLSVFGPIREISVQRRGARVKRFFVSEAQGAELKY
jgi:hypothetical protein